MKVIRKENKSELQFFFDTLLEIVNEWGEITFPEILSINKTWTKYLKNWEISYITINEVKEWKKLLEDPKSVFISLIIWTWENKKRK